MIERVRQLTRWISRRFHIPSGLALVLSALQIPQTTVYEKGRAMIILLRFLLSVYLGGPQQRNKGGS